MRTGANRRLLLPLLGMAACASGPRPAPRPVPRHPGQVLQPSTFLDACVGAKDTLLFSTDAQRETQARKLQDGAVVWTATGKGRLVHCDDEVAITAHVTQQGLTLHGLAVADGNERWLHHSEVPAWVADDNLSVTSWTEQNGGYGVAWSALTYWQGGYPPSEEEEREAHHEAKGTFVLMPGGKTKTISGTPFERAEVPAAIQKDFPGLKGTITWDGLHARFADGEVTRVVRLSDKERRTLPTSVGAGSGRLYLTANGLAVLVSSSTERDDDGREYSVVHAQCWDREANALWSTDLSRDLVPEPVP